MLLIFINNNHMAGHQSNFYVGEFDRKNNDDLYDMSRLNKENIPPNNFHHQKQLLKEKSSKIGNDSFLKRTHSMDIQQKHAQAAAPNLMNVESIDNYAGRAIQPMELEEFVELDKFDKSNKHNPQMVSIFARGIFEYLREKEVSVQ